MNTQTRESNTSMGPNHSAIVLSQLNPDSDMSPGLDNLDTSAVLSSSMERPVSVVGADVRAQETSSMEGENSAGRTPAVIPTASRISSPTLARNTSPFVLYGPRPEPSSTGHATRRAALASYMLSRRDSDSDPSTSLGRRVAARSSGITSGPFTPPSLSSFRSTEETNDRILEIATNIDRAIQRLNQHRSELVAAANHLRGLPRGALSRARVESGSSQPSATQSASGSARAMNLGAAQMPTSLHEPLHTVRVGGNVTLIPRRPTTRGPDNQTELHPGTMSNAGLARGSHGAMQERREADPMEGLPALVSDDDDDPYAWLMPNTRLSRRSEGEISPQAENPSENQTPSNPSNTIAPGSANSSPPSAWVLEPLPLEEREEIRAYDDRLRRRLQAAVRAVHSESSMVPRQPSANGSRLRRRGWARLDHNGNEITTDEEDEYERNRAHMRARAQAIITSRVPQAQSTNLSPEASTPPPPPPAWLRHGPDPVLGSLDTSNRLAEDNSVGPRMQRSLTSTTSHSLPRSTGQLRRSRTEIPRSIRQHHCSLPFQVDALPWKQVELCPSPPRLQKRKNSSNHSPRVLEQSPFAGR